MAGRQPIPEGTFGPAGRGMNRRTSGVAHGLAALVAILAGCATKNPPNMAGIPASLRAPETQVLSRALHGSGVQIYECLPGHDDPHRYTWVFQAPAAELSDQSGKEVGKHYAGPTWQADDGSKVVGEIVARDNGPDAGAIPWLLLRATSATGKGIFSKTQSIQRLHTVGGLAPASTCDASHAGKRERVPYAAEYYFYVARR